MEAFSTVEGSVYYPIEELGEEAKTVQAFQDELQAANQSEIMTVNIKDEIAESAARPHKSLTQSCTEQLEGIAKGEYQRCWITDSEESAITLHGLQNVMVSRTSIAESSAHHVFFARLSSEHHSVRVAIKPFEKEPTKAVTEWVNMKLAQERGLKVFKPLGFLIADKGYMVTERQDGVEPMDNAEWRNIFTFPEENKGLLEDIAKVGPVLARVHHKGCYHGDPQLKNLVVTQTGSVHLIDWEAATFGYAGAWRFSDQDKEPHTRRMAAHDLKVLFSSLARPVSKHGVGMLDGLTPATQHKIFDELLLTPYIEERLKLLQAANEPEHMDAAMTHLGEVEQEVSDYILAEDLQRSLSRSRQN